MGDLGWSLDRYLHASVYEFNQASLGYWRNWERNTAWLMREIVYVMIAGNPYIKSEDKPRKEQIIELSTDNKEVRKAEKKITPEELETIRQRLLKNMK